MNKKMEFEKSLIGTIESLISRIESLDRKVEKLESMSNVQGNKGQ